MSDLEEIIKDKNGDKIKVKLIGEDGNAFAILGRCTSAMSRAGVPKEARDAFFAEATTGDYDALIRTALKYFDVS
jgi:hypothetical protein